MITAKRLLMAIPPTMENVAPLSLHFSSKEHDIFSKASYDGAFTGLVSHPSLPANTSIYNRDQNGLSQHTPGAVGVSWFLYIPGSREGSKGMHRVIVYGGSGLDETAAISALQEAFDNLVRGGIIKDAEATSGNLEILSLESHTPNSWNVSPEDIKQGYFTDLYSLQGKQNTWWTGGRGWAVDYTSFLWEYNNDLLPRIIESL